MVRIVFSVVLAALALLAAPVATAQAARGQDLRSVDRLDSDFGNTLLSMQAHVQMVSKDRDDDIRIALRKSGFTLVGDLINGGGADGMRAYIAYKGDDLVIAIRGTWAGISRETVLNVLTDVNVARVKPGWIDERVSGYDTLKTIRVHNGFNKSYEKLHDAVWAAVRDPAHRDKKIWCFGHSMGAAVAQLAAFDLAIHGRNVQYIGSGTPRVGDRDFANAFDSRLPSALRFVVEGDPVATIPAVQEYEHTGRLLAVDQEGDFLTLGEIRTFPRFAPRWARVHNNQVYFDVATKVREKLSTDPGIARTKAGFLEQAAAREREEHRTLKDRAVQWF